MKRPSKSLIRRNGYRIPGNVQDLIPAERIWNNGIMKFGRRYSMTWKFSDIDYSSSGEEEREQMFIKYRELLNGLDPDAMTKITIRNRRLRREELAESVLFRDRNDGLDMYRREYNSMILKGGLETGGVIQEKYITVTAERKDIKDAEAYFSRTEDELASSFGALGSTLTPLGAEEKLRLLHRIYRNEEMLPFDMEESARMGEHLRDIICPDSMEIASDTLKMEDRYSRILFLRQFANTVSDEFIRKLTNICPDMIVSADIMPVSPDEAIKEAENRLLGIETNITGWQRRQNRNDNFSSSVPYDLELQRAETKDFLNDLISRDQMMMLAVITIMITAASEEELDRITESVKSFGRSRMCRISVLKYQQTEGLNTVLPFGAPAINAYRTLITDSLAVFIPFRVQEIMEEGGIYLGTNAVSGNLIISNRDRLMNQSAFILGVPGSGKSFYAKQMIMSLLLNTDDDILICDPEGEYVSIAEAAGINASVVRVSAHGGDRLNPMYIDNEHADRNSLAIKAEFILSLIERIENRPLGPGHRSVIDRCMRNVYRDSLNTGNIPTFSLLRGELMRQKEPEAGEIALSMEIFTTGSLSFFSGENTADIDRRMVVFDISELEENLKPAGLLVITDTMLSRVTENWKRGKRTHVFIDEFHVVFSNEHSAQFFSSAWRQFRKRNAYPTAVTQNVDMVLDSVTARTMLSNSEFIIMLNQAPSDREKLASLFRISPEQMIYIKDSEPGCGLLRYGGALVPFVNRFPRDTELYHLMTTKPEERMFSNAK